jgi:hypothetical protein
MRGEAPGVLDELHSLLEAEGGPLAGALRPVDSDHTRDPAGPHPAGSVVFAPLVSSGPRANRDPRGYALVVESILEGYLLHYARGRIVDDPDPDLRLLAGDHLYAFGLVRLAGIGDLEAVDELSDLISLCAQVHATAGGDSQSRWQLTAALWAAGVLAVAAGSWPAQRDAKRVAREKGPEVIKKVLDAARDRAQELGLESRLEDALIAFERTVES